MPRVSVLMPAYNVEKYVGEAIESILNQTFTDFEFIIINDGSTDNTAKIIKEYAKKDKRIRFIDNKKNQGLIAVLNQGLDLCTGEYIARMDSDDISLPERFAKQIEYMDNHHECGVCGTFGKVFLENGKKGWIWKEPIDVLICDLLKRNQLIHPTVFIRKDIIDKYNLRYNKDYKHAEDYAFWLELIKHTKIHNLSDILLNYRIHSNNIGVVYNSEQLCVSKKIRNEIKNELTTDSVLKHVLTNYYTDVIENFYLFGFIPIIRIKRYGEFVKTKYYILKKIPVLTVKQTGIYLFDFIKIGCTK